MTARERIARANRLDATRNGRPTAHCDDCGRLGCIGHTPVELPAQRPPSMDSLADRLAWERKVSA